MDAADLVTYFEFRAPNDMTWSQIRNLVLVRRAAGRPITLGGYEAIRFVLADSEARAPHGLG